MEMILHLRGDLAKETNARTSLERQLHDQHSMITNDLRDRSQLDGKLLALNGRIREMEMGFSQKGQELMQQSANTHHTKAGMDKLAVFVAGIQQSNEQALMQQRESASDIRTLIKEASFLKQRLAQAESRLETVQEHSGFDSKLSDEARARDATFTNNKVMRLERVLQELVVKTAKHQGALEDDWMKKFMLEHSDQQQQQVHRRMQQMEDLIKQYNTQQDHKNKALKGSLLQRVEALEDDLDGEHKTRFESDEQLKSALKSITTDLSDTMEDTVKSLKTDVFAAREESASKLRMLSDSFGEIEPMVIENRDLIGRKSKRLADLQICP
jgi:hypothetical protein